MAKQPAKARPKAAPAAKPRPKAKAAAKPKKKAKIGLIVSVRSLAEAKTAIKAGATLLDVREPNKGPLGMAPAEIAGEILEAYGKRAAVSASLGEWSESILTEAVWHLELPLDYILWGLAGYRETPGWGLDILDTRRELPARLEVMAVAYADHAKAKCVPLLEVVKFVKRYRFKALLLDTFAKDGKTLLNYLKPEQIAEVIESLHESGIQVALGGELTLEAAKKLAKYAPDWFAVRGAVCLGGKPRNDLDPVKLAKWRDLLSG